MAQVYQCDRCKTLAPSCTNLGGRDVCPVCMERFEAWFAVGSIDYKPGERDLGRRNRKNSVESTLQIVHTLLDVNGRITARAFAAATGDDFRAAYQRLRYVCDMGHLERVAGSVYRLPVRLESEAAE